MEPSLYVAVAVSVLFVIIMIGLALVSDDG